MNWSVTPKSLLLNALPVAAAVLVWWAATTYILVQPRIYPTPQGVFTELVRIFKNEGPIGEPYTHAAATLWRLTIAWGGGFVAATLLGVLAGRKKWVFDFFSYPVWIAMAVPSVVWVYIFLVVFGIEEMVPILALMILLAAPVFLGTAEGVRSTPKELLEMCDSYKIGTRQRLFHFYLPYIAPYMVANARVSFAYGIRIVLIAEVIGLPNGVGILVGYWSDSLYMAPIVAWGLLLMATGMIVDYCIFAPLQRRIRREAEPRPASKRQPSGNSRLKRA
ncbi:ABC transporter permease [Roseisalinus antarcticus]|uniref:Putative aliphatic sulfonates transport permease protein SsuC n=1 Tax=Roseisalinus antarcticus TaxID=254357 RepID=A0A1Y5U0G8_9RHOB|nr:ABC transporter permease subunit [Roseisalinus antarcticus]SLN75564.1 Putative aliphatic sulfonates transport permease protein SsuC [Roseisalinus antarcticus]